jgi:hypothetical protein
MKVFEAPVHKEENSKIVSIPKSENGIKLLLLPRKLPRSNNPKCGIYEVGGTGLLPPDAMPIFQ